MQEYLTHSEAETEQAGADFARALPDGKVVASSAAERPPLCAAWPAAWG